MKKRMTWADYKALLNKTGWNATAVGKSLGVSSSVMSQRFTALGIDFRKEKAEYLEKVRHLRRDLFRRAFIQSGYSVSVMAKKFGMDPHILRNRIALYGFIREPEKSEPFNVRLDESTMEKLREATKTIKETTGIEFTMHELVRTAVYQFSRKPLKSINRDCLLARGRSWRLKRRPQGNEKK